jgi:hypothetical protein
MQTAGQKSTNGLVLIGGSVTNIAPGNEFRISKSITFKFNEIHCLKIKNRSRLGSGGGFGLGLLISFRKALFGRIGVGR